MYNDEKVWFRTKEGTMSFWKLHKFWKNSLHIQMAKILIYILGRFVLEERISNMTNNDVLLSPSAVLWFFL